MADTQPVNSSGLLTVTATAVVCNSNCLVKDIVLNPAAAASVINIYDPSGPGVTTTTNATLVMRIISAASTGSNISNPTSPIELKNGCLVEITGSGATGFVTFNKIGG